MARTRLCRACKDFHDLDALWPSACAAHFGERASDAPYVRSDGMDPIRSMVSGKMHDSRSAYYAEVRSAGCEIVGNDAGGYGKRPDAAPPGLKKALREALERHS